MAGSRSQARGKVLVRCGVKVNFRGERLGSEGLEEPFNDAVSKERCCAGLTGVRAPTFGAMDQSINRGIGW